MVVVDSSAVIEFLLDADAFPAIARVMREDELHAPHLIDLEVVHSLRHAVFGKRLTEDRAAAAIADFLALPIDRHAHEHLLPRIWQLRDNASAYDASYIALAEFLDVPLITRDRALSRSPSHTATIHYID